MKAKCIESNTTQVQIAEDIGAAGSYVSRIIKKQGLRSDDGSLGLRY